MVIGTWAPASVPGYGRGRGTSIVALAVISRYRAEEFEIVLEHISRQLRRNFGASHAARLPQLCGTSSND